MAALPQPSPRQERRTQVRIQVQIPVKVSLPEWPEPVLAVNQDLSWGGACFILPVPLPREVDTIALSFPWTRKERVSAEARLMRRKPLGDGRFLVAVRFSSVTPCDQRRLEKLLGMLQATEVSLPRLSAGRLVKELEVTVNEAAELRLMLTQIATGQLTVTVFDSYAANQSISLLIAGATNLASIRLRARVSATRLIPRDNAAWPDLHTVLLAFEHPGDAIRELADFLLEQLPEAEDAMVPVFSDVPKEWLCVPSTSEDSASSDTQGDGSESSAAEPPEFPYARRY